MKKYYGLVSVSECLMILVPSILGDPEEEPTSIGSGTTEFILLWCVVFAVPGCLDFPADWRVEKNLPNNPYKALSTSP